MTEPAIRHEVHYGRVVRCFSERPANVDQLLRDAVAHAPDQVALVLGDTRLTYRDFDAKVSAVAANLLSLGLAPGDRVALLMGNTIEFAVCTMATARAGLIAVPMNVRQRRPEIAFVLQQCTAAVLVYDAEQEVNLPDAEEMPSVQHVVCVSGSGRGMPFADLERAGSSIDFPELPEESTYCLLYTSGTTGRPKGAMLSHFGVVHSVMHYQHGFQLNESDVGVLAVPGSHVTGLVAILLTMIRCAGTTVIMPAFKAKHFLELAERERMSYTLIVPAMYNLCLLDPNFSRYDLKSWTKAGFGGAPMPAATVERLAQTLPDLQLVNCYGSTETTSPSTLLPFGAIATHPTSVGKALPCADMIVVDENGVEVASGTSGEIMIAGPMVVPGYWDNPDANAKGFVGGYWLSGDVGSKDENGFIYVHDRKKDMINRAGFKVYCIEVESTLSYHPDVVEVAVIGKPDPVLGEKVHAFVWSDGRPQDPASLKAWCAERLSDYKVPDSISFLDEPLPRNPNGKILKTTLREQLPAS
ncbi:class I adenylate-forming enzyme family protein [Tianweitania sediminis]|uniref:Acyl--CoA ligase n=1 Tax=Tianweitania sediminis TaxID=1502156 RepID=A0A8J7UN23_9HYPH|nr:class I adenylate-forming enzyme family protein [Tianweitania sediminis]MBP0441037.1 acyl--CoA ligase [Tianweitania sediminis]